MEMNVTTSYRGNPAVYKIRKEMPGVYYADLLHYEGDDTNSPPATITLLRGIRKWTGSCEDDVLLNDIGIQIEGKFSGMDI